MRSLKTLVLIGVSSLLCLMILSNAKMAQTEQKVNYQNPSSSSNEKRTELNGIQFEPKSAVHGYTKEHFRFSSETWEASDGVAIFLRREYCGSLKNAEKRLGETLKTDFVILETRPLSNRKGETTGRRIVAVVEKDPTHQRVIFWIDGDMLYSVESSSFVHALAFEKLFADI